jgi:cystathionine beta-lyase
VLLSNPHNPTGTVHTPAELQAVAELADRTGVRVVVDEIHAPLTHADAATFTPYLSVPGSERGFVVFSASKAWNLAGLKAALVVAGPGAAAHTVALTSGQDWLDEHLTALATQRDLLGTLLADRLPQIGYRSPAATYLAWLDCRALGLDEDPAAFFLEHARVALSAGPDFGAEGAGYVRLNFATATAVLTEAVDRMAAAVALRTR